MIKVKKGVQPPIIYIAAVVANVAEHRGITLVVTSGLDSRHSDWSGHYQLRCLDVRSKNLDDKNGIVADIYTGMEVYFPSDRIYVAIHDVGKRNEHIHCQFK